MELKLTNVRLAFPVLWTPKPFANGEGEPAYSASFILAKSDPQVKTLNAAIDAAAKEKWADKAPAILKLARNADKTCLHDGDLKADYEGFPGNYFIAARNKSRPLVLDRDKTPLTESEGKPYAGCYVHALLDIWAQDNKYGKRVNATLRGVQFVKDGDAFTGSAPATPDAFDDLSVDTDTDGLA